MASKAPAKRRHWRTTGQCSRRRAGGLGWLEVECRRCRTRASLPLSAIRRPRDTPLWKLEVSLKCRFCRNGRHTPPVRMIELTATREITPHLWVHPEEERSSEPSTPTQRTLDQFVLG